MFKNGDLVRYSNTSEECHYNHGTPMITIWSIVTMDLGDGRYEGEIVHFVTSRNPEYPSDATPTIGDRWTFPNEGSDIEEDISKAKLF